MINAVTEPPGQDPSKAQISKGKFVIQVDYGKYIGDQKGEAEILAEKAALDNGATDREYTMLAIMAINRLLALSLQPSFQIDKDSGQDLPCVDTESEIRAA